MGEDTYEEILKHTCILLHLIVNALNLQDSDICHGTADVINILSLLYLLHLLKNWQLR